MAVRSEEFPERSIEQTNSDKTRQLKPELRRHLGEIERFEKLEKILYAIEKCKAKYDNDMEKLKESVLEFANNGNSKSK